MRDFFYSPALHLRPKNHGRVYVTHRSVDPVFDRYSFAVRLDLSEAPQDKHKPRIMNGCDRTVKSEPARSKVLILSNRQAHKTIGRAEKGGDPTVDSTIPYLNARVVAVR